ncbi:TonB-dependent receptor [Hymenobacter sp. ASUV-10]|uniref:TonB-dependent receptor n=1 Tax=Hymenobacter aranciens TaxID=3063996 RepID=A0ABT9BFT9_9BACT|nr:TonB-dependent receptor [Hymenobacter sp. ASUV-10]MDO7877112.1 TonB-dependent receptor [Hymenobacter sp. ASUV-10]
MRLTSICSLLLLALLLASWPMSSHAQGTATAAPVASLGSISGVVLDSLKKEPVPYATVALLPAATTDNTPVTGVAADEQGRFSISKVAAGNYRLQISFVGFTTQSRNITVSAGDDTKVGSIRLAGATQQLGEAVVVGTKPVVEVRPDRLVYNAAQDATNAGGNAQDVLRKAPLLAVDGEGNVTMRGSANFKVLINNKPSPTMAANLKDALKSIPAENIQSVEVITTPPAKYDGEGTAGIINIVLKKGVNQKLNGNVNAFGGNRNRGLEAGLNFRQGKFGFTSSASVGNWYNPMEFQRNRTSFDAAGNLQSRVTQRSEGDNQGGWQYVTMGLDFDPAEHHSFSLAGTFNHYAGDNKQTPLNQTVLADGTGSLFSRRAVNVFSGTNADLTATYTRTFKQPRREWSVLGQYSTNGSTFGYDFDQYYNRLPDALTGRPDYTERSRGRQPGHEITLQTDYVQPLGKDQTLEFGAKAIFRNTGSNADVDTLTAATDTGFGRSLRRATDFDYDQNVQALYGIYSFKLGKKLNLSLGTRAERTDLKANFRTTETGFARDFISVLPNGSAQYAFNDTTSVRAAYSRRITRPYIDFLNPFVNRADPSNINYGNPNLDPELTDSYELSYNTMVKSVSLNMSLSARRTNNAIEQVTIPSDSAGVTESTFRNVAANAYYQFNVYFSAKPLPKWDISGGPDVQYITRRSPALGIRREGFTGGLNLNSSYRLPKDFTLSAFAFGSLPMPDLQGRGPANLFYGFAVKKQLLKKKADLTLNVANPFNSYWAYQNRLDTPFFSENNEFRAYQRSFRVSFNYRFGQEQQGKQRKQIRNDDVKGGGGRQGGGQ